MRNKKFQNSHSAIATQAVLRRSRLKDYIEAAARVTKWGGGGGGRARQARHHPYPSHQARNNSRYGTNNPTQSNWDDQEWANFVWMQGTGTGSGYDDVSRQFEPFNEQPESQYFDFAHTSGGGSMTAESEWGLAYPNGNNNMTAAANWDWSLHVSNALVAGAWNLAHGLGGNMTHGFGGIMADGCGGSMAMGGGSMVDGFGGGGSMVDGFGGGRMAAGGGRMAPIGCYSPAFKRLPPPVISPNLGSRGPATGGAWSMSSGTENSVNSTFEVDHPNFATECGSRDTRWTDIPWDSTAGCDPVNRESVAAFQEQYVQHVQYVQHGSWDYRAWARQNRSVGWKERTSTRAKKRR